MNIIIVGADGDRGKRKLEGVGNIFERKNTNVFGCECVELGELQKIRLSFVIESIY